MKLETKKYRPQDKIWAEVHGIVSQFIRDRVDFIVFEKIETEVTNKIWSQCRERDMVWSQLEDDIRRETKIH